MLVGLLPSVFGLFTVVLQLPPRRYRAPGSGAACEQRSAHLSDRAEQAAAARIIFLFEGYQFESETCLVCWVGGRFDGPSDLIAYGRSDRVDEKPRCPHQPSERED